jgi:autotransporter-associated beta strand protein
MTVASVIQDNSGGASALTMAGSGTLLLSAANTYSGPTTIDAGTLQLNSALAAKNSTVAVNVNNGLAFGSGVTAPSIGGLAGSGNVNLATTDATPLAVVLTVGGNNANTTYSGTLSGSGGLTKVGAGAMILAGSNLYSGGTEVEDGTLVAANGANGSATGSGNVTLSGGTLAGGAGGGSISGGVLPGSAASTISSGGVGPIGQLTIGSLTTASNMTLNFDLAAPGRSGDLLTIANGLTVAPGTAITFSVDPTAEGSYRLIGGNFGTPTLSDFVLPSAPSNRIYSLSTTVDPGYIDLDVVPEPSTFALLGAAAGLLGWAWPKRKRAA